MSKEWCRFTRAPDDDPQSYSQLIPSYSGGLAYILLIGGAVNLTCKVEMKTLRWNAWESKAKGAGV